MSAERVDSEARYVCWCDGVCDGTTTEPFGLCPECTTFHHRRGQRHGLTEADVRVSE